MTTGKRDAIGPSDRSVVLADRLHSAAIHLLRDLRAEDEALGLSAPKLSALSVLVFRGPLSVGALARAEQVTAATTSRLVTELEAAGLATRSVDPRDARVRRVSPTEEGVALLHEGRRRRVARLAGGLDRLSSGELGSLELAATLLERVVSSQRGDDRTGT